MAFRADRAIKRFALGYLFTFCGGFINRRVDFTGSMQRALVAQRLFRCTRDDADVREHGEARRDAAGVIAVEVTGAVTRTNESMRGHAMRCLLTAFEPFGGESLNPSLEVARSLRVRPMSGVSLKVLELPVDRIGAIEYALRELRASGFDAVVMLGEAGGRYAVSPERVAVNLDDYRIPDNAGHQPRNEPILVAGPPAYFSTLPLDAMVQALHARAIPGAISNSAGTYLCNRLFYCVMHELAQKSLMIPAGFVHLPYLHEQAVKKPTDVPSLSRETQIDAVACLLGVLTGIA